MKKIAPLLTTAALALTGLAATPQSAQAATNVCTGVSGCRVVGSSDIDRDKKTDQIGMVYSKSKRTLTTRVKTATRTMSTTDKNVDWYWEPLYGITAMDGVKGNELVVGSITGANTYWFRVITHRGGKLTTLKPPLSQEFPKDRWAIQGSYNFNFGYTRSVSSTGVVRMVEKSAERQPAEGGDSYFRTTAVTYEWRSTKWVKVSTKKADVSNKAGAAVFGWRVKGLPLKPYNTLPKSYKSCTALNKVYAHGVGRFGAKDKTSGTPVKNFSVRTFTYYLNDGPRAGSQYDLDRDNDGIACEKR